MLNSIFRPHLAGLLVDGDGLWAVPGRVHVGDDVGLWEVTEEAGLHILALLLVVGATSSIVRQNGNILLKK